MINLKFRQASNMQRSLNWIHIGTYTRGLRCSCAFEDNEPYYKNVFTEKLGIDLLTFTHMNKI